MDITSLKYLIFLLCLTCIYYIKGINQKIVLLIANLLFFVLAMQENWYAVIQIILIAVISWGAAVIISSAKCRNRKLCLIIAISLNLAVMILSKYNRFSFFAAMGISYFSLSAISYVVDVYWGIVTAEKSFFNVMIFISYFPLLVSGPIVKYDFMKPQLFQRKNFDYEKVRKGLVRIVVGLVKKLVLASRFYNIENAFYINWELYQGIYIWIFMFEFTFELFFDFSGCMDIIIGTSNILGIDVPENFNLPFFSKTVSEFWRRWHITLGGWFKEYFLYPLLKSGLWANSEKFFFNFCSTKQVRRVFTWIAMLLLWIFIGLWHGIGWTYVFEGLFFGICIVFGQIIEKSSKKIKKRFRISDNNIIFCVFQMLRTFVLISVGLLFFNSSSLDMAFGCLRKAFCITTDFSLSGLYGAGKKDLLFFVCIFMAWIVCSIISYIKNDDVYEILFRQRKAVRWLVYYVLLIILIVGGEFGTASFIYANF